MMPVPWRFACSGYIEVKWHKVIKDSEAAIDTDGDGKITTSDVAEWGKRLFKVIKVRTAAVLCCARRLANACPSEF